MTQLPFLNHQVFFIKPTLKKFYTLTQRLILKKVALFFIKHLKIAFFIKHFTLRFLAQSEGCSVFNTLRRVAAFFYQTLKNSVLYQNTLL